jgi:hypothetical protein
VPTVIAFAKGDVIARADSILALGLSEKKWAGFREKIQLYGFDWIRYWDISLRHSCFYC